MCPKLFATTVFGINRTGSDGSSLERSHILPLHAIYFTNYRHQWSMINHPKKRKKESVEWCVILHIWKTEAVVTNPGRGITALLRSHKYPISWAMKLLKQWSANGITVRKHQSYSCQWNQQNMVSVFKLQLAVQNCNWKKKKKFLSL